MRAIRRRDTIPELALRSKLHRLGYRFRCDLRLDLAECRVRTDIVFTRRRVAVFVDGCFWHSCPVHGRQPEVNGSYWGPKLQRTVERDRHNTQALLAEGWVVVRVWEHESAEDGLELVVEALKQRPA